MAGRNQSRQTCIGSVFSSKNLDIRNSAWINNDDDFDDDDDDDDDFDDFDDDDDDEEDKVMWMRMMTMTVTAMMI